MSNVPITYAGAEYLDRMRALQFGIVQPEGVNLTYLPINNVGELFRRMAQDAEFEVSEMSMSTLMVMVSQGDDRLIGIPVFPSRAFRHSQIYIHAGAGIERPEDLAGRNVGVPEYQMTAALWQRALLKHEYGVDAADVHWWTGGLKTPEYHERHHHGLPGRRRPRPHPRGQGPGADAGGGGTGRACSTPMPRMPSAPARRTWRGCSPTTAPSSWTTTAGPRSSR